MLGALIHGGALATFIAASAGLPRDRTQGVLTSDTAINVANGLLLFGMRVTLVAQLAMHMQWGLLDAALVTHPAAQYVLGLLMVDFGRYWLHRAHHRVPWLWTFHRVHHMTRRLDATAGLRMHIVDFVQLSLLPLLLFGGLLDVSSWAGWVLPAVLGTGAAFDAFQHANLAWRPGHPLARAWGVLLNHPHFHAWHHSKDGAHHDGNYGNTLVIWDRCFRSVVTGQALPEAYGLDEDQDLANHLIGMQLLRPIHR